MKAAIMGDDWGEVLFAHDYATRVDGTEIVSLRLVGENDTIAEARFKLEELVDKLIALRDEVRGKKKR